MFDAIIAFFRALVSEPRRDEILIPVRVEKKRDLLNRR